MTSYRQSEFSIQPNGVRVRLRRPDWVLRLRLRWACHCIGGLERELADDFATDATLPLQRELTALLRERDTLQRQLARAGVD